MLFKEIALEEVPLEIIPLEYDYYTIFSLPLQSSLKKSGIQMSPFFLPAKAAACGNR